MLSFHHFPEKCCIMNLSAVNDTLKSMHTVCSYWPKITANIVADAVCSAWNHSNRLTGRIYQGHESRDHVVASSERVATSYNGPAHTSSSRLSVSTSHAEVPKWRTGEKSPRIHFWKMVRTLLWTARVLYTVWMCSTS